MAAFRNDSIFWVEVEKIVPNPYQPRRVFEESKLKELAESIRMYGVLQPLTVSRIEVELPDGAFRTEYELIAGERRLRASKLGGLSQVPVLIREGEESEQEKLELAIIENLQREDLNAVDRALAFRQLADVFGLSHVQVAKKVGRSREYVSNTIRLLGLPDYMQQSLRDGDISEGHARTLLMLNDRPEEQDTVFREVLFKKLSVREVERIARKIATDKVRNNKWVDTDPELIEKEKEFTETLGTRVQLQKTDYGGKITIDYFSDDDLENFLAIMKGTPGKFSPMAVSAVEDEIAEQQKNTDATLATAKTATATLVAATPLEIAPEEASTTQAAEVIEETPIVAVETPAHIEEIFEEEKKEEMVKMEEFLEEPEEEVMLPAVAEVLEEAQVPVKTEEFVEIEKEVVQEEIVVEEAPEEVAQEEVVTPAAEVIEEVAKELEPVIEPAEEAPVPVRSSLRDRLAQLFVSEPKPSAPVVVAPPVVTPVTSIAPAASVVAASEVAAEEKKVAVEAPAVKEIPTETAIAQKDDDEDIYNIKGFTI